MPLEDFPEKILRELLAYAQRHSVEIEVGARKLTAARLSAYLEIAGLLDSRLLRFIIDGPDYTPEVDEVVEIIRQALPALDKNRIYLALENHDRLLTTSFVEIIEKVGFPVLQKSKNDIYYWQ